MSNKDDYFNLKFNLILESKICRILEYVRFIKIISGGLVGIGDDNYIRVWGEYDKQSEQFKLLLCQSVLSQISSFEFYDSAYKCFIGLSMGLVAEYKLSQNMTNLTHIRNYNGHKSAILCIFYSAMNNILLTGGQDKILFWHNTTTGLTLGSIINHKIITALDFDSAAKLIFIGDSGGDIHLIKIEDLHGYKPLTVLKEHTSEVTQITWDPIRMKLYSGSNEGIILIWDIGGNNGKIIQLEGHTQKISKIIVSSKGNYCLSSSMDGNIIAWNMTVPRKEPVSWRENDFCENCKIPFFWNFKSMIEGKIIGVRQHHCRQCGRALCNDCCNELTILPHLGYEIPVRVCSSCFTHSNLPQTSISDINIGKNEIVNGSISGISSLSQNIVSKDIKWSHSFNTHHPLLAMDMNEGLKILVTSGGDKIIKVWNISSLVE
ncbi:WD repeat and FYVE domain-containing protein 2-like isoform X2 [Gordionus sp. m RMFG-2023]|uniref:WD repeat and FYVE domain-containing protein 2-like isoform X2 n=1 Tax=Gordionus sp. m RMFG-2023 TaxID=3053472 RepID=UPI0031FC4BD4